MNLWPTPRYPLAIAYKPPVARNNLLVIGGPCSWESGEQINRVFSSIGNSVDFIRGGLFRAGTYPPDDSNYGWKMDLLKYVHLKCAFLRKPNVVDVLDIRSLEDIEPYTGVFQIGERQAQHYALLKELGRQNKPVILKRGRAMKYDELMGALEYILQGGNQNVFLCERGSSSHFDHVRFEFSVSMIAKIKKETNIPIIADASHGTGISDLVGAVACAGVAAGADGILLETHPDPDNSLSDKLQAISFDKFHKIVNTAQRVHRLVREGALVS